jgi:hypothetical protein
MISAEPALLACAAILQLTPSTRNHLLKSSHSLPGIGLMQLWVFVIAVRLGPSRPRSFSCHVFSRATPASLRRLPRDQTVPGDCDRLVNTMRADLVGQTLLIRAVPSSLYYDVRGRPTTSYAMPLDASGNPIDGECPSLIYPGSRFPGQPAGLFGKRTNWLVLFRELMICSDRLLLSEVLSNGPACLAAGQVLDP